MSTRHTPARAGSPATTLRALLCALLLVGVAGVAFSHRGGGEGGGDERAEDEAETAHGTPGSAEDDDAPAADPTGENARGATETGESRGPGDDEAAADDAPEETENGGDPEHAEPTDEAAEREDRDPSDEILESDGAEAGDGDAEETNRADERAQGGADDRAAGDGGAAAVRELLVAEDDDQFGRVEGRAFDNVCDSDADCHVGGCSSEVCSADPEATTTCEMPAGGFASAGGACGCVRGECRWYSEDSGGS